MIVWKLGEKLMELLCAVFVINIITIVINNCYFIVPQGQKTLRALDNKKVKPTTESRRLRTGFKRLNVSRAVTSAVV